MGSASSLNWNRAAWNFLIPWESSSHVPGRQQVLRTHLQLPAIIGNEDTCNGGEIPSFSFVFEKLLLNSSAQQGGRMQGARHCAQVGGGIAEKPTEALIIIASRNPSEPHAFPLEKQQVVEGTQRYPKPIRFSLWYQHVYNQLSPWWQGWTGWKICVVRPKALLIFVTERLMDTPHCNIELEKWPSHSKAVQWTALPSVLPS